MKKLYTFKNGPVFLAHPVVLLCMKADTDVASRCRVEHSGGRRQHSKGARSFRGQKILKPGHPESGGALFPQKSLRLFRYSNIFIFLFTLLPKQSNRPGGARAVDLPARSFDLARPGVAPPLAVLRIFMLRKSKLTQYFHSVACITEFSDQVVL